MSWEDELRKVREEARAAEEQRRAQALDRQRRRRSRVEQLDAMVRELLDGVGLVEWGRWLLGKRYTVSKMDYQGLNKHAEKDYAEWKVCSRGSLRRHRYSFSVRLYLDPYGNPSHFEAKGRESVHTTEVSEIALREALKDVFRDGPHTEP